MLTCGDGVCDPACENCLNCQADCGCAPCTQTCNMGVCVSSCGDGACDPNCETCSNCAQDCGCPACTSCSNGACVSDCGDGICDANCENCGTCPTDCVCNDGVACTNDSCQSGTCVYTPNDAKCSDQNICNGIETCDPILGCIPGQPNACAPPIITCPADKTCECDAACVYGDPVVQDDCSIHPTFQCTEEVIPGKFPQERTILRTCTTTNDCGQSDSCTQRIEIVDTTPPTITCPPDVSCECGQPCNTGEPIVSDNCDPDPLVTVEITTITNDCRQPQQTAGIAPPPKLIQTFKYTATDGVSTVVASGGPANTATCTQTVNIVDTIPPVLSGCVNEMTACGDQQLEFTPPTCFDSCGNCSPVICERSDGLGLNDPVITAITITCSARDECDNPTSCTTTVNVLGCSTGIPTVSQWGLIVMALFLLIGAKVYFARRSEGEAA